MRRWEQEAQRPWARPWAWAGEQPGYSSLLGSLGRTLTRNATQGDASGRPKIDQATKQWRLLWCTNACVACDV